MSRTRPSLKPGSLRPFRAEVGFDRAGFLTVQLYAVASFQRPSIEAFDAAHSWELKQASLAINAAVADAGAGFDRRRVITTMLKRDERQLVVNVCERYGWLRKPESTS